MKTNIIYNTKKTLMIHSFQSKILNGDGISVNIDNILDKNNMCLNNSFLSLLKEKKIERITFDDGLYQQIELLKIFSKNFNDVYFFPSGHLVRPNNDIPVPQENSSVHKQYHEEFQKIPHPSTFMSSFEVWDLIKNNLKFGIHGWYHYNLNPKILSKQIGNSKFKNIMLALKDDAAASINWYFDLIKKEHTLFINDGHLYINYCTPYNCLNEYQKLYIDFLVGLLKKHIQKNQNLKINEITIEVFSNERIPFEELSKGDPKCH